MKSAIVAAVAASSLFVAGNALAADAVVYDQAPAPVAAAAPYDWTGLYLGVHAGITTGDFDYEAGPAGGPALLGASVSGSGFIGGAQIGYDWQSGPWVFGALADIAFSNHEASLSASLGGIGIEAESQLNYLGTVRGRVGYAFDRVLFYGHGGFAYGETEQTIEIGGVEVYNDSTGRTGWTIGAGLEYALTDRISFGTEYSYVDLGDEEIYSDPTTFVDEDVSFHTIKAVINFRF